jgi:hypothetical protein
LFRLTRRVVKAKVNNSRFDFKPFSQLEKG